MYESNKNCLSGCQHVIVKLPLTLKPIRFFFCVGTKLRGAGEEYHASNTLVLWVCLSPFVKAQKRVICKSTENPPKPFLSEQTPLVCTS